MASNLVLSSMNNQDLLVIKEKLASLIREHVADGLKSQHFRSEFTTKVQPLFDRIRSLEDDNRRLKITLEFFKNELKEAKSKNNAKKTVTKDQEVQVDELQFLREREPEDKDKSVAISSSLKRTFGSMYDSNKMVVGAASGPTPAKVLIPISRVTNNVGKPGQLPPLLPSPGLQKAFVLTNNGLVNGASGQHLIVTTGVNKNQSNVLSRTGITYSKNNTVQAAPTLFLNSSSPLSSQAKSPSLTTNNPYAVKKSIASTTLGLDKVSHVQFKHPVKTYAKNDERAKSIDIKDGEDFFKKTTQSKLDLNSTGSVDSFTSTESRSTTSRDKKMMGDDDEEIMEVEPPKPRTPELVELLSDDEDDKEIAVKVEIKAELPDCIGMHPLQDPVLPFVISSDILPLPKLSVRPGLSRDKKQAVILRMESMVDTSRIEGSLQYRIFSYFQNVSEKPEERKWKQLTVIKVQCGKICECTLTQLMPASRYHFVVCLVNGNNRSPFSNCATCIF